MNDIAIIISVAAFATAVLGPLITTWITCAHDSKMHKKRFYEEHKQQVIENYLKSVGKFVFTTNWDDRRDFGESTAEIFMYAPKRLWPIIRSINSKISQYITTQGTDNERKTAVKDLQNCYFELCEEFHMLNRDKGICMLLKRISKK